MGIWGLVGGGVYRGDYEAGKNNGVVLCYLWQLLNVVTAEGIDTYLTYSTSAYLQIPSCHCTSHIQCALKHTLRVHNNPLRLCNQCLKPQLTCDSTGLSPPPGHHYYGNVSVVLCDGESSTSFQAICCEEGICKTGQRHSRP